MADGFGLALWVGIRAALVADSNITDLVSTRVYGEPPNDPTFPYIRRGNSIVSAFDVACVEGATVNFSIEVHSRSAAGDTEAMQVVEAVKTALHRQESSVTVTGFTLVELIFQTFSPDRDPEGRGYTATIAFQAMLE